MPLPDFVEGMDILPLVLRIIAYSIFLNELRLSGTGFISINDFSNPKDFMLTLSGAGDISYKGMPTITGTITGTGLLIGAN